MRSGAAYARYSTDRQCSIEVQFSIIEKYCLENGIFLSEQHKYEDEALSGMRKARRRGFNDLVAAAEAGELECIVFYDLTRGARDVVDWFQFRKDMMRLNVEVIAVMDKIGNLDNPADFLTELLTVGIGQHHVLTSRLKSMEKIDFLAQQGLFCGGYTPFGYDVNDKEYVVNEAEADIVRTIFSMYANGRSYAEILDALPLGLTGRRGKPFSKNSIHYMLKNERYTGRFTWNKRKQKYFGEWAGGGPNERFVTLDDVIPAIVDSETWEKVRARMAANKKNCLNNTRKENRVYLLSGLIRCGHCNAAMVGITTTNKKGYEYKFYSCGDKYRNRTCKAKNIPAAEIETLIVGLLRDSVLDGTMIEKTADAILEAGAKRNSGDDEGFVKKEIASIQAKQNNLMKAIEGGLQDVSAVHERLRELETKRRLLEEKLKALKPKATVSREYLINELATDIASLRSNPAYIKDLISKYIVEIVVSDDSIEIYSTADLTMRMVIPEDWTVITANAANLSADGITCAIDLSAIGCGGRI